MALMPEYGTALGLYAIYALLVGVINIAGIILLFVCIATKKIEFRLGEFCLPKKEAAKTVFKTSGIIVCTVFLVLMTVLSLFS